MSYTVSIITPTLPERAAYLSKLKADIDAQTYKNTEWVVISGEGTIGEKRNKACAIATGDIIVNFDDDDHYEPRYIEKALEHLVQSRADITGLKNAFFVNEQLRKMWLYEYKGAQPYVIGSGMMYHRKVWEQKAYEHVNEGEDYQFITNAGSISAFDGTSLFYARIHGNNTASQKVLHLCRQMDYSLYTKFYETRENIQPITDDREPYNRSSNDSNLHRL